MSYTIEFTTTAFNDLEKHKKAGDIKLLKKIDQLLNELLEHPKTGSGQPEALKYGIAGLYSRRINKKHRLVYRIREEIVTVIVLGAYSHYGDK